MAIDASYIEALERALGRIVGQAKDRLALFERHAEAVEATINARLAEGVARLAALDSEIANRFAAIPAPRDGEPGAGVTVEDVRPLIAETVAEAVRAIPAPRDGEPGASVTVEDVWPAIADAVAEAVRAIPAPRDGEPGASVTADDVRPLIADAVVEAVRALPAPRDGQDGASVTVEDVWPAIADAVAEAVADIPIPRDGQDGASVTVEDVRPLIADAVADAVRAIPPPEPGAPGEPGPPGALPVAKAWIDRVHYQGDVVTHAGGTYQATRDTGRGPLHKDWICLAAPGAPGDQGDTGRSFEIRGTYDPDAAYQALDVVALGGGSFVARQDDPGPCPGAGWQLLASQGGRGKPGDPGRPGTPGPAVRGITVDGEGLLTLVNADGSTVECDLYPLLIKVRGA